MPTIWAKLSNHHIISIDGTVMRVVTANNMEAGTLLTTVPREDGYVYFHISCGGVLDRHYMHRAMLQLFYGEDSNRPYGHHKDSNPTNNILENLEWVTQSDNVRYSKLSIRGKQASLNHSINLRLSKQGNEIRSSIFRTTASKKSIHIVIENEFIGSFSHMAKVSGLSASVCSRITFANTIHVLNRRYGETIHTIIKDI